MVTLFIASLLYALSFAFVVMAAYIALDVIVPSRDAIRWHRVGGLVHWRFGRFGGSFYRSVRHAR